MKTMKKFISLFIAVLTLSALLCGCGDAKYKAYDSTGERYDCYLPDYIDVCNYNNLEVPDIKFELSNELLEKKIIRECAIYSPTDYYSDRAVKNGDIVDLVTECYMDGEPYDYLTFKRSPQDKGYSIVVGCNELDIPEVDEALVGMKKGESKTITFNLPDPFYRSLYVSGKEVTMTVTVNKLGAIDNPKEPTDELFQKYYGYTLDEYKAYWTHTVEEEYNTFIKDYKGDYVWDYIYENSTVIEYPEECDTLYNTTLDAYRAAAKDKDLNLVEYVTKNLGYKDLEAFEEYLHGYVKDVCKREMILYYVARCENLNYTQEYYETELLEYAEEYEIKTLEEAESFVDFQVGLTYFKERVRLNYVYEWLGNNATVRTDVHTYNGNDLNK